MEFELLDTHVLLFFFFFQAEDGIRDLTVTGVQTCALPISRSWPPGLTESRRAAPRGGPRPGSGSTKEKPGAPPSRQNAKHPQNGQEVPEPFGGICSIDRSEERRVGKGWRERGGRDHWQREQ